jgi:uncharacterized protein
MAGNLRDSQMEMARYLRNPQAAEPPADIEPRRLKIYQDLIYNNVEGFISGGFPVLRSLYSDTDWHELVRQFIDVHRCHTPYFLEISQEFIDYLLQHHAPRPCDPPYLAELAHYERVELALDIVQENPVVCRVPDNLLEAIPRLSPLAWVLSYHYPVHRIGPGFELEDNGSPTFLVVYRNSEDEVKFVELNGATARLLSMAKDNDGQTCRQVLLALARELSAPIETVLEFGEQQLREFYRLGIVSS